MSFSTTCGETCGQMAAGPDVAVISRRERGDTPRMSILPRMIAIGLRRYTAEPEERKSAVEWLVCMVLYLARQELGAERAKHVVSRAMLQKVRGPV